MCKHREKKKKQLKTDSHEMCVIKFIKKYRGKKDERKRSEMKEKRRQPWSEYCWRYCLTFSTAIFKLFISELMNDSEVVEGVVEYF